MRQDIRRMIDTESHTEEYDSEITETTGKPISSRNDVFFHGASYVENKQFRKGSWIAPESD
jgi:hypothetical protein